MDQRLRDPEALKRCQEVLSRGVARAVTGLAQLVGQEILVSSVNARLVPLREAAALLGGPDASLVAVYLEVWGSAKGHMVFAYRPEAVLDLIDLLLGASPRSPWALGELERSALGEVGNIMGSSFLGALAEATGARLQPSPPVVVLDMAGAILDAVMGDVMQGAEEALVLEVLFGTRQHQLMGTFLVMPNPDLVGVLLQGHGSGR